MQSYPYVYYYYRRGTSGGRTAPHPRQRSWSGVNVMCVPHLPVGGGGVVVGHSPIGSQDAAAARKEREIKKPLGHRRRPERDCFPGAEIQRVKVRGGRWESRRASKIFYCRRVSLWPACKESYNNSNKATPALLRGVPSQRRQPVFGFNKFVERPTSARTAYLDPRPPKHSHHRRHCRVTVAATADKAPYVLACVVALFVAFPGCVYYFFRYY